MAKEVITIFQKREWSKDVNGERIVKYYYAGFPEKGQPYEFSTNRDDITIHEGERKFNKDKSEEFDISAKFDSFKGKMTYYETGTNFAPEN